MLCLCWKVKRTFQQRHSINFSYPIIMKVIDTVPAPNRIKHSTHNSSLMSFVVDYFANNIHKFPNRIYQWKGTLKSVNSEHGYLLILAMLCNLLYGYEFAWFKLSVYKCALYIMSQTIQCHCCALNYEDCVVWNCIILTTICQYPSVVAKSHSNYFVWSSIFRICMSNQIYCICL